MNLLFSSVDIRKITGGTLENNTGMINIMKKNGMIHEATQVAQEIIDNKPTDTLYFCKFY